MKLLVFSHKECWKSADSPSGWATDGGFAIQMDYLSKLFQETKIIVPEINRIKKGEVFFTNKTIEIIPVKLLFKKGFLNKLFIPFWAAFYLPKFLYHVIKSDAIHAPIPSNIGTIGFLLAHLFNKPLYIRYCGNWLVKRTVAEKFWQWYMIKFAGGKKVFLATGGASEPPSIKNKNIKWIFSTSLTAEELKQNTITAKGETINKLCIVCRQEKGKGTEIVIETIKKLSKNNKIFYLDIVGEGSYLKELKDIVSKYKLENQITFYGKLNHLQVLDILKKNHIFVYPTASEGFPKVVIEAMSQGLPVITTNVSILGKLIQESKAGLIIEKRNADDIILKLNEIVKSENYNIMSINSIKYAKKFTLEHWTLDISNHLEKSWKTKLNTL
jgi:glycosyltransferase involved in cell wall biosynthesis